MLKSCVHAAWKYRSGAANNLTLGEITAIWSESLAYGEIKSNSFKGNRLTWQTAMLRLKAAFWTTAQLIRQYTEKLHSWSVIT